MENTDSLSANENLALESQPEGTAVDASPCSASRFLGPYVVPKFSVDVQLALGNNDGSILNCRRLRSKIVAALYEDLLEKVGRFVSYS
jgi:hypothetical protein